MSIKKMMELFNMHPADGNTYAIECHLARIEASADDTGQQPDDECGRRSEFGFACTGMMVTDPVEGVICDTCGERAGR